MPKTERALTTLSTEAEVVTQVHNATGLTIDEGRWV